MSLKLYPIQTYFGKTNLKKMYHIHLVGFLKMLILDVSKSTLKTGISLYIRFRIPTKIIRF